MPNWCATNWTLKGPKDEITRFADAVNSLKDHKPVKQTWFGNFYLPNFLDALGVNYKEWTEKPGANLRGVIDPRGDAPATWGGPDVPEDETVEIEEVSPGRFAIAFSTVTAWGVPDWLITFLSREFPHCEYEYKATDEFGNFHERTPGYTSEIYQAGGEVLDSWKTFDAGEEREFLETVNRACGIDLDIESLLKDRDWERKVRAAVGRYNEDHRDDGYQLYMAIYTAREEEEQ